ncbi:MAG: hypothetical protein HQL75_00275 [Magnetococcales bacterium]|nr:hypothetical protein [Magnetococcales bacterium]
MPDYLAAEPLIISRLEEMLPDVKVKSMWGMQKIQESSDMAPAVFLILEQDVPGTLQRGQQLQVQIWTCIIATTDPKNDAGLLISRVIQALNGWRPDNKAFTEFKRVQSGIPPQSSENHVHYFALAFSTSFVFNF